MHSSSGTDLRAALCHCVFSSSLFSNIRATMLGALKQHLDRITRSLMLIWWWNCHAKGLSQVPNVKWNRNMSVCWRHFEFAKIFQSSIRHHRGWVFSIASQDCKLANQQMRQFKPVVLSWQREHLCLSFLLGLSAKDPSRVSACSLSFNGRGGDWILMVYGFSDD